MNLFRYGDFKIRNFLSDIRIKFEGVCAIPYRHEDGSLPNRQLWITSTLPSVHIHQPHPWTPYRRQNNGVGPVLTVIPILTKPNPAPTTNTLSLEDEGESWEEARPKYNIDWRK